MTDTEQESVRERAEAEAADWFARLDSDAVTDQDLAAFDAWLSTPVNQDAFARVEAIWLALDEAPAAVASTVSTIPLARSWGKAARPSRGLVAAGLAAAASLVAAVVLIPQLLHPAPQTFETARGEDREVALEDGSRIHMGGGSRLVVRFARDRRRVEMASLDGEAAFDVAKDPGRPFVITAGDRTITVVGTEFDVRRAAGALTVTVRRGVVEVAALTGVVSPVRLTPGKSLRHRPGEARSAVSEVDPAPAFGWTAGERTYRDEPLSEVAADLNRYFAVPLRVDPSAARLKFTGFLKIDGEDAVVARLQAFLPIQVVRTDKAIILRHAAS